MSLWPIILIEITVISACSVKRNPCPKILLCLPGQLVARSVAVNFTDAGWTPATSGKGDMGERESIDNMFLLA